MYRVVAALAQHGVNTEEGTIAIQTYCNPLFGTQAETIFRALNRHYSEQGIQAQYRYFDSPLELPLDIPVVIAIKYSFLVDHFVVVTRTAEEEFRIIDPIAGTSKQSLEQLTSMWRNYGVVVQKLKMVGSCAAALIDFGSFFQVRSTGDDDTIYMMGMEEHRRTSMVKEQNLAGEPLEYG